MRTPFAARRSVVQGCKPTWSTLANGSTLTVHNISTDTGVAADSLTATFGSGDTLSGTFATAACPVWNNQRGPINDPNYCSALQQ